MTLHKKLNFPIKDFLSKCDQIRENFIGKKTDPNKMQVFFPVNVL